MNITLDDKTKHAVVEQAKQQLLDEIMRQLNAPQIASEVKNEAVKQAVALIADELRKKAGVSDAIKRAVDSVNGRINSQIQKLLSKGITMRFEGLLDSCSAQEGEK